MIDIINRQVIGDGATWMCNSQFGAPQMTAASNANGQLLQVLDAVLVDGFNSQTATGVELLPEGFIKIKFGTAVDYQYRQKLLISGANDDNLNGEHIVAQVIGNDVVIKAPDVSVITGAIKTKVAPLGWESIFGTTNPLKRAYRSKNPNTTQKVLYLDMTLPAGHGYHAVRPAHRAMVSICDDMIEIGVPIGSYTDSLNDYNSNVNGSLFWHQAKGDIGSRALAGSTPNEWTIVGNSDYFYFMPSWIEYDDGRGLNFQKKGYSDFYCFGDMPSLAGESDRWNCVFAGGYLPNDNGGINYSAFNGASIGSSRSMYYISSYNGVGSMLPFSLKGGGAGAYYSGSVAGISFPNPTTQSMVCEKLYTVSQGAIRSIAPRISAIQHALGNNHASYDRVFIDDYLIVPLASVLAKSAGEVNNCYFSFDMGD